MNPPPPPWGCLACILHGMPWAVIQDACITEARCSTVCDRSPLSSTKISLSFQEAELLLTNDNRQVNGDIE